MADIEEIKTYLRKLQRVVETGDFKIFGKMIIKKNKVDNILCCVLAVLPESFKTMTKDDQVTVDKYPAVASFNRMTKVINNPFFLSADYYSFSLNDVITLIQNINKNIKGDIAKIEEIENI